MPRPNPRDADSDPKAFLGRRLANARVAAGYASQEALAGHLGLDRSVVAKAETGERPPSVPVLSAWVDACSLDRDMYEDLGRLARRSDGPIPRWGEKYLAAEETATVLRIWQPIIVPGLLQTTDYARELFAAMGNTIERVDELIGVRLGRQAILDRDHPPHVIAVLDEIVLHRLIGSPKIMADQLDHLVALSKRPDIQIQVIPSDHGANAALSGAFTLVSGDGTPDLLSMTHLQDIAVEISGQVTEAALTFERARGASLPCTLSRELIEKVSEQWNSKT